MTKLTKDIRAWQDTLWLAVLDKGANVDRRHYRPLSCFWLFDAETSTTLEQLFATDPSPVQAP
jgi:hypothetical protein